MDSCKKARLWIPEIFLCKYPSIFACGSWTSTFVVSVPTGMHTTHHSCRCDDIDISTSKKKPLGYEPATYSHAQKMRAAMTHQFGREFNLGMQSWTESQVNPGKYLGNPSLSTIVSQYMISLRRKKVFIKFLLLITC